MEHSEEQSSDSQKTDRQAKGVEYAKKMARGYLKSNGMGNYATVSPKSKTSSSVKDKTII